MHYYTLAEVSAFLAGENRFTPDIPIQVIAPFVTKKGQVIKHLPAEEAVCLLSLEYRQHQTRIYQKRTNYMEPKGKRS